MKDLEMTQTDIRPTDRPTSRDASHLKIDKPHKSKIYSGGVQVGLTQL